MTGVRVPDERLDELARRISTALGRAPLSQAFSTREDLAALVSYLREERAETTRLREALSTVSWLLTAEGDKIPRGEACKVAVREHVRGVLAEESADNKATP